MVKLKETKMYYENNINFKRTAKRQCNILRLMLVHKLYLCYTVKFILANERLSIIL